LRSAPSGRFPSSLFSHLRRYLNLFQSFNYHLFPCSVSDITTLLFCPSSDLPFQGKGPSPSHFLPGFAPLFILTKTGLVIPRSILCWRLFLFFAVSFEPIYETSHFRHAFGLVLDFPLLCWLICQFGFFLERPPISFRLCFFFCLSTSYPSSVFESFFSCSFYRDYPPFFLLVRVSTSFAFFCSWPTVPIGGVRSCFWCLAIFFPAQPYSFFFFGLNLRTRSLP